MDELVLDLGQGRVEVDFEGKGYGPFARGDLVGSLPEGLVAKLKADGKVGAFDYGMLAGELLA